jgi:hypothetical protein
VFDYSCVVKQFKSKNVVRSIVCPLCKRTGNLLFPVLRGSEQGGKGKFVEEVAERIMEILKEIKDKPNFYEEVIKCFYHYVLLCSINYSRTVEKRS